MSQPTLTAVLIEDEPQIRRFVRMALEDEGWKVHEATSLRTGLTEVGTRKPDLVVLDLGLPDGDGNDLIREVRTWSQVPIIVLSARLDERDKIAALDAGADDYLTKPFGVGEFLARVRASCRRARTLSDSGSDVTQIGDICIDASARVVSRDGAVIHLTPIEYRLLSVLVANVGRVLTHRQLMQAVWGPAYVEQTHHLRVHMGHLRQKLERDPAQPRHLRTETGVGYRLAE